MTWKPEAARKLLEVVPPLPIERPATPLSIEERFQYWGEVYGVCERGLRRARRMRDENGVLAHVESIHDAVPEYDDGPEAA